MLKRLLLLLPAFLMSIFFGSAADARAPFGYWRIPPEQFSPQNGDAAVTGFSLARDTPQALFTFLDAARRSHMHVVIAFGDAFTESIKSGSFSLADWERGLSSWCPNGHCVNLQPYITDGTLMGINLFEYSVSDNPRGPSLDEIRQAAAYTKSLWPSIRTFVDSSHPCLLQSGSWSHADLDGVMITVFSERLSDPARRKNLIEKDIACARGAGLAYTLGVNPLGATQHGLSDNSLPAFRWVTEYMLEQQGQLATLIWRWFPNDTPTVSNGKQTFANFWNERENPGLSQVMQEISRCAANPSAANCPAVQ